MKITWYGHSCFAVERAGYTVLFDPYTTGSVPGLCLPQLSAGKVLCSHEHKDHCNADAVKIEPGECPFAITEIQTFHDHHKGEHRGQNMIRVLEADGLRVAHLGDLGHLLSEEQAARIDHLDAVMIPVGGHFTIDALEAKKVLAQIDVRVVIPMHYRSAGVGYDAIGTLDAFTNLCDDVQKYSGNSIEVLPETPRQTAVLSLPQDVLQKG